MSLLARLGSARLSIFMLNVDVDLALVKNKITLFILIILYCELGWIGSHRIGLSCAVIALNRNKSSTININSDINLNVDIYISSD